MSINIDLLFLVNFTFTALIIWTVSSLWGTSVNVFRIVIAALLGTLYLFLAFFFLPGVYFLPGHVLSTILMVITVWGYKNPAYLIRFSISLYGVAFFMGGAALALWNLVAEGPIRGLIILATLLVMIFSGRTAWGLFRQWRKNKGSYKVCIHLCGRCTEIEAYLDTGNFLRGPNQEPVVLVTWHTFKVMLPTFPGDGGPLEYLEYLNGILPGRTRVITYSSVGRQGGILITVRPDGLEIFDQGRCRKIDRVLLGLFEGRLPGGCKALLPCSLLSQIQKEL